MECYSKIAEKKDVEIYVVKPVFCLDLCLFIVFSIGKELLIDTKLICLFVENGYKLFEERIILS